MASNGSVRTNHSIAPPPIHLRLLGKVDLNLALGLATFLLQIGCWRSAFCRLSPEKANWWQRMWHMVAFETPKFESYHGHFIRILFIEEKSWKSKIMICEKSMWDSGHFWHQFESNHMHFYTKMKEIAPPFNKRIEQSDTNLINALLWDWPTALMMICSVDAASKILNSKNHQY